MSDQPSGGGEVLFEFQHDSYRRLRLLDKGKWEVRDPREEGGEWRPCNRKVTDPEDAMARRLRAVEGERDTLKRMLDEYQNDEARCCPPASDHPPLSQRHCSQCGQLWGAPACGPTHALIAHERGVAPVPASERRAATHDEIIFAALTTNEHANAGEGSYDDGFADGVKWAERHHAIAPASAPASEVRDE